jgi:hypothetical protein
VRSTQRTTKLTLLRGFGGWKGDRLDAYRTYARAAQKPGFFTKIIRSSP